MTLHACNAWCADGVHTCVLSTPDNPPSLLHVGTMWWKGDQRCRAIKVERASPEFKPGHDRPNGYQYDWLVWFEYV